MSDQRPEPWMIEAARDIHKMQPATVQALYPLSLRGCSETDARERSIKYVIGVIAGLIAKHAPKVPPRNLGYMDEHGNIWEGK